MAGAVQGHIGLNTRMLVICEDDYLFNNRWYLYSGLKNQDLVNYAVQVLVRSDQTLENLFKFKDITFLKISRLLLAQLKQFNQVMHLEIDLLLPDQTPSTNNLVKMMRLRRLKIDKLDETLLDTVTFNAKNLNAVKLGKKDSK